MLFILQAKKISKKIMKNFSSSEIICIFTYRKKRNKSKFGNKN